MCLAYPGTVIGVSDRTAMVTYPLRYLERSREISPHNSDTTKQVLLGDTKVKVGDRVLVQMGIVIKVISETDYSELLEVWEKLK